MQYKQISLYLVPHGDIRMSVLSCLKKIIVCVRIFVNHKSMVGIE